MCGRIDLTRVNRTQVRQAARQPARLAMWPIAIVRSQLRPVVARATITASRSPSRTTSLRQAVVLRRVFMAAPLRGVRVPGGSSHLRGRSGSSEARGARSPASDRLREAAAPSAVLARRSCESGVRFRDPENRDKWGRVCNGGQMPFATNIDFKGYLCR
jgi:hypothetical protein